MRYRLHHVGKDAKVLQSSLRVPHPTMPSYPTPTVGCASPSSDFQLPPAWNFRVYSTKKAVVDCLISCLCSSHLRRVVTLRLKALFLRNTMLLCGGLGVHLLSWLLIHLYSAISVPSTAQGLSDGGIVCVPSQTWYNCDSAFRNRTSPSNVVQAHLT